MPLTLILIATALATASGLPGLFARRRGTRHERAAAALLAVAAAFAFGGVALQFATGRTSSLTLALPLAGRATALAVDALSAIFLVPIFLTGALGAVYGLGYWREAEHPENARKLRLFWGLMIGGMALLVLARHALMFLFGWEVMALSAYFLIGAEDDREEVRASSWVYLIAAHLGTLCLLAMFALWRLAAGSFDLHPLAPDQAGLGLLTAIFFLALVGFGLKAGIAPFHFWLPSAHANAPSHVSAFMSGVLIKMGIYGLVRITGLLPDPPLAWGAILLGLGAVSGVLGVAFAIGQHDLKRLLAYHSVENIGIIVMGLGLALAGRSLGRADWVVLGMAGCLLHVWNHSLFKSLLFLGAGSVVHATGTRQIDRLGGLAKPMPWTAALFLVGAIAICGLPPLNGFMSELFIYMGSFRSVAGGAGTAWPGAALAAPMLALIGALAVACFVKAYGAVFLGSPRSEAARRAHEAPRAMTLSMSAFAACCALIGLAPFAVAPLLDQAIAAWGPPGGGAGVKLSSLVPLAALGVLSLVLWVAAAGGARLLARIMSRRGVVRGATWDCGYARPTPRMQYTASSFAQMLVGLLRWALRPRTHDARAEGLFPPPAHFESHVDEIVLDRQLIPLARAAERALARVRALQRGLTQQYVLYILAAVIAMLIWTMPVDQLIARLFAR